MAVDKNETTKTTAGILEKTPERRVGEFNSTGQTGIQVDLDLQFGTDLKDEKLLKEFISKFNAKQKSEIEDKEPS